MYSWLYVIHLVTYSVTHSPAGNMLIQVAVQVYTYVCSNKMIEQ